MGFYLCAVAQRLVGDKYVDAFDVEIPLIRDEPFFTKAHHSFLGLYICEGSPPEDVLHVIAWPRGYPEDYNPYARDGVQYWRPDTEDNDAADSRPTQDTQYAKSWLMIDELVNFNYAAPNGDMVPWITVLGPEFIQYWKDLKAKGIVRIVFGFD